MSSSSVTVSYNPEDPPLLVLAVAQLLGLASSQLKLQAASTAPRGLVELTLDGNTIQLAEVEAAKRIAFLTATGRECVSSLERSPQVTPRVQLLDPQMNVS